MYRFSEDSVYEAFSNLLGAASASMDEKKIDYDSFESPNAYLYKFIIPGLNKEYLKVFSEDGKLSIEYENKKTNEEKNDFEWKLGSSLFENKLINKLKFSIKLNGKEDIENLKIKYLDGILNIEIPKKEEYSKKRTFKID